VLLSAVLVAFQIGRPAAPSREHGAAEGRPSTVRRSAIVLILLAWAFLVPQVGFFVTSMLAFFVITAIASFERLTTREMALYAAVGMVVVGAFQWLMVAVLNLRMPQGWLF
jgi:putative tricarboxylic transport membrane protein